MAEIDALVERIDELDAIVRKIERIVSKGQRSADKRKWRWLDFTHHKIERNVSEGQGTPDLRMRRWLNPIPHFADLVLDKAPNVLFVFVVATFLLIVFLMLIP